MSHGVAAVPRDQTMTGPLPDASRQNRRMSLFVAPINASRVRRQLCQPAKQAGEGSL